MTTEDVKWLKEMIVPMSEGVATLKEQVKHLATKEDVEKALKTHLETSCHDEPVDPAKWANAIKIVVAALAAAAVSIGGTLMAIQ